MSKRNRIGENEIGRDIEFEKRMNVETTSARMNVVAALLRDAEGRFMVGRRPAGKSWAGLWEFVGGKIEPGETPAQALARECREETGAEVVAEGFARREERDGPHGRFRVDFLWARLAAGEPRALEHDGLRFADAAALRALPFCPADAPIAAWLASGTARPTLLLASASARRWAILADLGANFLVRPADANEPRLPDPVASVRAAALAKHAAAVRTADPALAVLAADTLVECDGRTIGKPRDREDAIATLLFLSGREHRVHTAVALSAPGRSAAPDVFVDTTRVRFRALSRDDAAAYLDAAGTLDRAGAYDVATLGERVVESLDGSFTNVMGLPAERIGPWLASRGLL